MMKSLQLRLTVQEEKRKEKKACGPICGNGVACIMGWLMYATPCTSMNRWDALLDVGGFCPTFKHFLASSLLNILSKFLFF